MATSKTGTASAPYNNVVIETVSGEILSAPPNTNDANLRTAVQSHVHEIDAKVRFDSMAADFRPPDTGDSTNRWRMVCGTATVPMVAGYGQVHAVPSTDAVQGNPSFTAAPVVVTTPASGGAFASTVSAVAADDITVVARSLDGGTYTGNLDVYWMAYGKIA